MATVKYYNSSTSQWEPILYGAQGDTGAAGAQGATNSLSIGTVTNGLTAGATITGSAPSQTLNLVLPLNANAIDADSIQILTNKTLASPEFTGIPIAPTASAGTNTTQLATTAFVATSFAPLASPALTGTPTAPTAATVTNNTQIATTAFVTEKIAATPSGITTGKAIAMSIVFGG
jgi:hypothetical protein